MKKSASKTKVFRTLAEFASAIGVPLHTLAGWVRRPDWLFEKKSPWPLQRAKESLKWASNLERGRHGKDLGGIDERSRLNDKKQRLDVRKLQVQLDQAKAEYARSLGQLVPVADVEAAWAQIAVTVRNAVENIPSQIVPLAITCGMPHEAAAGLQKEIESLIAIVLRHLSANETKVRGRGAQGGRAGTDAGSRSGGEEVLLAAGASGAMDAE